MDINKVKDRIKNKNKKSNNYLKKMLIKSMALLVAFLITIILIKSNDKNKEWIEKNILSKNISFSSIKTLYTKYFGDVLPLDSYLSTETVFNEKLTYKEINKYKDGISLTVDNNYLVPVIYSGIVTFIGDKEEYGKTIIIESDNVIIWYSNIENTTIKLYDYVEKGSYLGETINDKLYLLFKKDGKVVNYKEYI